MSSDVQRHLERLGDRAMPGAERFSLGDWIVRADRGATGRANSCWPAGDPGMPLAAAVETVEQWYLDRSMTPVFQVYDGYTAIAGTLLRLGYKAGSGTTASNLMVTSEPNFVSFIDGCWEVTPGASEAFFLLSENDDRVLESTRTELPQRCVVLSIQGTVAGGGLVTVDNGWAGIFLLRTAENVKRQGVGGAVMRRLVVEARSLGATMFWLQVMPSNEPAIALYTKAAFTDVHYYSYFAKPN